MNDWDALRGREYRTIVQPVSAWVDSLVEIARYITDIHKHIETQAHMYFVWGRLYYQETAYSQVNYCVKYTEEIRELTHWCQYVY